MIRKTFKQFAKELFDEYGDYLAFDRINQTDRRKLCAAWLRDNPDHLGEVLDQVQPRAVLAEIADMIEAPDMERALDLVDAPEFVIRLHRTLFPNRDLELLVDTALLEAWDEREAQKEAAA